MFFSRIKSDSDENLMRRVQQGDGQAMTELYRRYSMPLLRYFHRMLWKDENRAQDFLQDVFVKIMEQPESFDADKRFRTWIYSVAYNMCKNEYRRVALRGQARVSAETDLAGPDTTTVWLEEGERLQVLEQAVDQLDEDTRHLFTLRYTLDMSVADMATTLGCAEGTIKSRLFYMRQTLAALVKRQHQVSIPYGHQ